MLSTNSSANRKEFDDLAGLIVDLTEVNEKKIKELLAANEDKQKEVKKEYSTSMLKSAGLYKELQEQKEEDTRIF